MTVAQWGCAVILAAVSLILFLIGFDYEHPEQRTMRKVLFILAGVHATPILIMLWITTITG